MNRNGQRVIIALSLVGAFMLQLTPIPEWSVAWRPAWIVMAIIFWSLSVPHHFGVLSAWTAGLFYDVLSDSLIGQHALGFALVAYITLLTCRQVRVFPVWQQAFVVFFLVLISQIPSLWISGMGGYSTLNRSFFYPALTSMLLWHWLFILLCDLRRYYRITDES
jgi:rod shape-determining protein MreD